MKHEKLNEILSELRARLKAHYGDRLVDVVLFGSQARGNAVEGSDIDVMVVLKGRDAPGEEILETSAIIGGLSLAHDILISTIFVSEDDFRYAQSSFMLNVRQEGVAV